SEGYAAVLTFTDLKWGYIDTTGKIVVTPAYVAAGKFSEGLAPVATAAGTSANYGYINTKGNAVINQQYDSATPFGEGLAAVRSFGELVKFIDTSGKTVIQPQFTTAGEFSDGLAPVEVKTTNGVRWGFINKKGDLAIS